MPISLKSEADHLGEYDVSQLGDTRSRHQKYRAGNLDYVERESKRGKNRDWAPILENRRDDRDNAPFIAWDTEGTNTDATPFLFGSSTGDRVAHRQITSQEMFGCLLRAERRQPDAIHIIFGGEYDFNMMLRNVPRRCLIALKTKNKCRWDGYEIEHIPHKWIRVKKDGITAKIFDVHAFFGSAFLIAIKANDIGTPEEQDVVQVGKEDRRNFTFEDIAEIEPYWHIELKLLVIMMDKLREAFYDAGVRIHSWHGPGALARYMLTHHGIKNVMAVSPPEVHEAARYAFCGGRFESFQAGLWNATVFNADINSAYPYAATLLPNLAKGRWHHIPNVSRGSIKPHEFTVYHIRYEKLNSHRTTFCMEPQPLFRRFRDDRVMWPNIVTGWYWAPEAANVADNPYAEFLEAWTFVEDDETDRPFAWLGEYYDIRLRMKQAGNPMQITFKLGPNSVYGQLAQRAGWERDGKPPKFHQLEYAGFVTSVCRAMIHKVAMYCWEQDGLLSIDTDGVFATCPIPDEILPNGSGTALGQWGLEMSPAMLNWQSGVYFAPMPHKHDKICRRPCPLDNGEYEWKLKKSRGAPKGRIPYSKALEALPTLADIEYVRTEMIGYRLGLIHGFNDWRYFRDKPRKIAFGGSKFSKRNHWPRGCRTCAGKRQSTLHDLSPIGNGFDINGDSHSVMHVLPWENNDHIRARDPLDIKQNEDPYVDSLQYEYTAPGEE